jgi:hypothetical protein
MMPAGPAPLSVRPAVAGDAISYEESAGHIDLPANGLVHLSDWSELSLHGWRTGLNALMIYLLGPHPLEVLYRRVLAIAEGL